MKIQRQDGCQAADTLGDLNNELTPVHCGSQAGHFKELFSAPCFLFLFLRIIFNMVIKIDRREGRRGTEGEKELSQLQS